MMNAKWIRNLALGSVATLAWLSSGAGTAQAQNYHHGHHHNCAPYGGYTNYSYRPITTLPYYGSNYGVGGYSRYSSNYSAYRSNYGGYPINYGNAVPFGGGYGMGGFPAGASYGGGAFPRGGSYGGGGFSLYIGR